MPAIRTWTVVLLPLLAITTSAQDMSESQAAGEQIRALRALSNDAIAAHDVAAIVSFFDEEYQITASTGSMSHSIEEEIKDLGLLFDERPDVIYVRTPDEVEVSQSNPLAAEYGTWQGSWTTPNGPVRTGGSYSAMWRNVGGEWKIRTELFVALYCEGIDCP